MKPSRSIRRTVVCLFLVASAALLTVSCGDDNPTSPTTTTASTFAQITSLPTTTTWEKIWGLPTGEVFVMGEDGVIFRKNGDVWDSLNSGPAFDRIVHSAWGERPDNLYFVGRITDRDTTYLDTTVDSNVTVDAPDKPFITQYNGLNFADAPISGIDWGLFDIWGSDEDDIYAVGYDGTVVHYDGAAWEVQFTGGTSPTFLTSVWGRDSAHVFACGAGGALLFYDTAWQVVKTHTYYNLWDVWGIADMVYLVGANGTIIRYGGNTMTPMPTGITNSLYGIWGSAQNNLYAVGWSGKILHFDGSAWTEEDDLTDYGFLSVWGTGDDDVYVAGQMVLHYDGVDWTPVKVRNEPDFNDLWAGSDGTFGEVVGVGSGGHILRSAATETFYTMTVNDGRIDTDLNGVGGFSDTAWFAVGDNGTILQRDESDLTNWVSMTSGVTENLNAVAVLSRDLAYAVGDNGTVLKYDGSDWTEIPGLTAQNLNDVWVFEEASTLEPIRDTSVYAVGDAGTILYMSHGVWDTVGILTGGSPNLRSVHGVSSSHAYAVGDGGAWVPLLRGSDTWVAHHVTTENLTAIWVTGTDESYHVFAMGNHGLVLSWPGAGEFTELATGVGIGLRCAFGFSAANFYVGGDCNHLLHYRP